MFHLSDARFIESGSMRTARESLDVHWLRGSRLFAKRGFVL